jgi:hypothetical protein
MNRKKFAKNVADSGKGIIFATTLTKDAEKRKKEKHKVASIPEQEEQKTSGCQNFSKRPFADRE